MRKTLALMAVVFAIGITGAFEAEAKRLGGAKSSGMQRQTVNTPAQPPGAAKDTSGAPGAPGQAAAPAGASAAASGPAAAAAGAQRSWMAPLAGLAAGLGIAALASHLGFGEALANLLTMALVGLAIVLVAGLAWRAWLRQRGGPAPAYAASGQGGAAFGGAQRGEAPRPATLIGSRLASAGGSPSRPSGLPHGFDKAGFERQASSQFIALQAANDAGDLERLGNFLSPDMLAEARADLQARDGVPQKTEVFGLAAELIELVTEHDRYIASVRFTGSVRYEAGAVPETLDEVWHLTKPVSGPQGWLLTGIQQIDPV